MQHRTRRRSVVVALSLTCASSLMLGVTAHAAPVGPEPTPWDNHSMGSQIRKHENVDPDPTPAPSDSVAGIDVSGHQGTVDWQSYWDQGNKFAYVKATEGTTYKSETFADQYNGSYDVGMIRGAYHFALPDNSSGADQANYFVDNGGGWSADGKTLPGALDMEYNPYGDTCYGLSGSEMGTWIQEFNSTYKSRTGRYPAIYTSASWWNQCVSGNFSEQSPLWVANYADSVGTLPSGWSTHTIWQYSSDPIDQNLFNGPYDRLEALAKG